MKNKCTKVLSVVVLLMMLLSILQTVLAVPTYLIDTTKTGSLTLKKQEQVSGSTESTPLAGVTFTIYEVPEEVETVDAAETYITDNSVIGTSLTTGEDGTVKFENLKLARYYVKETAYPENVIAPIDPFLVDVPMTNEAGTDWVYDIVAEPKNQTVYGDVNLIKTDASSGEIMPGVKFKLQKLSGTDTWTDYVIEASAEFTTGDTGTIVVENLPAGTYRFVEVSTLEGYILNEVKTYEFTVEQDQTEAIVINATNEKVEVEKQVKLSDGAYGENVGVFEKDDINYKISTNVPTMIGGLKTFEITDTNLGNIDIDETSIVVKGVKEGTETTLTTDVYTLDTTTQNTIKCTFDTSKLVDENSVALYDTIVIEYKGKLVNVTDLYGTDITNTANVIYSTVANNTAETDATFTDSDTANVHTGEVLIKKTNKEGTALAGAQFKIATSEENAKDGVYVTDANGADIVATSSDDGYVVFSGLKYGNDDEAAAEGATTYWLVETKAPADYNLLKKPVEVTVNATSGEYNADSTLTIVNKQGFELPATGGIGAVLFTIAGIAIIVVVVILLRKKDKNEK